ncbi:MAG: Uma2 family endonuclease [Acidobacteria bacterium]|nr:Uma2 family endonuclease [Acidobacteriota bacterium]
MSAQPNRKISSYLATVKDLPEGGMITIPDVTWGEYELLLADLGDRPGLRVNYDRGRLWIMSPSQYHEMYTGLLHDIGRITAEETGCDFECRGSATFKKKSFPGGMEPDTCFFIQNAARVIGKRELDPRYDPPPDVIVEIDISSGSLYKLDFYADLGVPEIWRYDEKRLHILHLIEQKYVEATTSRALPALTADALSRFLEQSKTEGQSATLRSFRQWLRENLPGAS